MMVNKKCINSLSRKILKNNRTRNLFVIIAIVLTTLMFTTIFTSGAALFKGMQNQVLRQAGSMAHGTLINLTKEQYTHISDHPSIEKIGESIFLSPVENESLKKRSAILQYGSDIQAYLLFSAPYTGKMPIKENEIVVDTLVLDALNLPYETGQAITIEFYLSEKFYNKEFIVSGIYRGDILVSTSSMFVSLDLLHELENENNSVITDSINASVMYKNSNNIDNKMLKIIEESGYSNKDIKFGTNLVYKSLVGGYDVTTTTIGILLFLVIIFTGYLVIYNIFSISISKDIRLYGMLKTVGTTPTQIKKIVRNQVYSLALIGIPIGLLLGYGLGAVLLPTIIASLNIDKAILSVNPIIFIGSSLFALLTIYLGSRKPAKIASKITPVEALRYQNTNIKKAVRKSNNTKIYKLAWNNLIRDKKKSIIIITTMFLSLIILNSAFSFSKGMSMEKFVETMISSDYTVASSRYFKYQFNENSDSTSDVLINKIDSSGIVEEGTKIYYTSITHILSDDAYNNFFDYYNKLEKEEKLNGYEIEAINGYKNREFGIPISAYGMNAYGANKLEIKVGTFDAEKFLSGRYIILGAYSDISTESHYNAGDKVTLDFKGVSKSYEVMAIADLPYSMSVKYYPVGSIDCFIPNTEFERIYEKPSVMSYIFDIKAGYENEMDTLLQDFTTINDKTMDYNSKQTISKEFDDTKKMLLIVGGMLSFTIGLISIANFINSMFASIITRRTELAMMKSIGMTKKQLRRMLGYEGLYYGGIPVFLALIMEVGFRNFFARTLASQSWAFDYQFTILPLLVVAPVFLVISLMIPYFANKKASNISLIEQLRGAE